MLNAMRVFQLTQLGERLLAVQDWHHHVEQDQVERFVIRHSRPDHLERLLSIMRDLGYCPRCDKSRHDSATSDVIFDN